MVFVIALIAPAIALIIGRCGLGRVGRGRRVVVVAEASAVVGVVDGASVAGVAGEADEAIFGCVGGTVSNDSIASDGNDSVLGDIGVGAGSGSFA